MKIIIIGGGIAGYSAGLFLHRLGADVTIYEARARPSEFIGGGVGLATNGIGIITGYSEALGEKLHQIGYPAATHELRAYTGQVLGNAYAGRAGRWGKHGTIMCSRWSVHQLLLEELESVGVKIVYGKWAEKIVDGDNEVSVTFKDGEEVKADLLAGADGSHSVVRAAIVGPNIKPTYEGLTGVGGFIPRSALPPIIEEWFPTPGTGRGSVMTFGRAGFFGIAPSDRLTAAEGGKVMWWSTFEAPERAPGTWKDIKHEDVIEALKKRHGNWLSPIPEIINAATDSQCLGNYDLTNLPTWHAKRMVLLGDAAHVMQPHSGQGISCALEDAAYLAFVLKPFLRKNAPAPSVKDLHQALETYQAERKPRVEKIIAIARRVGDTKKEKSPLAFFFMRWGIKVAFKFFMTENSLNEEFKWKCPKGLFDPEPSSSA